ncbi:ATP-binding protein [Streptomyces olivoreticuli]|uniref:sensor histidine kinase n=1 Tax=Streptomyces olivoreticuli TaxID=68246 RepID=UPI00265AE2C9|nr:ATP-binding protein [Streptomyces olivoreticuli]WKK20889.1 ATP-binding protein [Streptomyces olivoreticuli]
MRLRFRGPALTARTRIAAAYGAVFLVLGTLLLVTVNVLSRAGTREQATVIARTAMPVEALRPGEPIGAHHGTEFTGLASSTISQVTGDVSAAASQQLVLWSALALLLTALLAVGVGWWTAGRVLRPVHSMTATARRISERNLHERIGQRGPDDELKELADTIDALLGRLEGAFDSQRRFVSNASHELRTPLATQRAAIQVGLDGDLSPEELARTKALLLETNRRSEHLIDGLLVLARSERGLERRDPLDLADVVAEETAAVADRAEREGVRVEAHSSPAPLTGNRVLLAQLTGNLLRNAVGYNHPGGSVEVDVRPGRLTVTNTGPEVAAEDVDGLFEPFRRGAGRERLGGGTGLGLSIVRSIARAHDGTVEAVPRPGGGLRVTVRFRP